MNRDAHVVCAAPGCRRVLHADRRHVDNLAAKPWRCRDHQHLDESETP